jgi:hypothetical protein
MLEVPAFDLAPADALAFECRPRSGGWAKILSQSLLLLFFCGTVAPLFGTDFSTDLHDPRTKLVFHLDPDGHHLSALRPDGTTLWQIDSDPKLSQGDPDSVLPLKLFFKQGRLINGIQDFEGIWPDNSPYKLLTGSGAELGPSSDFIYVDLGPDGGEPGDELGLIRKSTGEYFPFRATVHQSIVAQNFQDPRTGITFHLNPDRHHLSATRPDGSALWAIDTKNLVPPVDSENPFTNGGDRIDAIVFTLLLMMDRDEFMNPGRFKDEDFLDVKFDRINVHINEFTGKIVIGLD